MSARWSTGSPASCSGAMYSGVPTTPCVRAPVLSSASVRAMPKSVSTTRPLRSISTFAGFRSRCTTPAACAAASPSHTDSPTRAARAGSIACRVLRASPLAPSPSPGRSRSSSCSVVPSTNSIVM